MIYFIYNFILLVLSPCLIFYYTLRVIITKKERKGFWQRLGRFDKETLKILKSNSWIWVHAVSVGEVVAASSMIREIKALSLPYKILLSTVTDTGRAMAEKIIKDIDCLIYFPLDFSFVVKKVIKLISPKVVVLVETEIWPNFLRYAKLSDAKILMLNGRISDKSFKGYFRFRSLIKPVIENLDLLGMQSEQDAQRIIEIGASPHKVRIVGNTKLDVDYVMLTDEQKKDLKMSFSNSTDCLFFTAGSTHKGEEDIIVSTYCNLQNEFKNLRLIIAPRHPERVTDVEKIVKEKGLSYVRKSTATFPISSSVIILDTIGDLITIYGISDIVFVGGSLLPYGGHNILEPISFGKVVLVGPYTNNFSEVVKLLKPTGAVILVQNEEEVYAKSRELLLDSEKREQIGKTALLTLEKNKGSSRICALLVKDLITN